VRPRALGSGLLVGLAFALSPKIAPLVLVAPMAALQAPRGERLRTLTRFASGLVLPILPILLWLALRGELGSAWASIVSANLAFVRERVTYTAAGIPLEAQWSEFYNPLAPSRIVSTAPLLVLAGIGLWRLRASPAARVLGTALVLWTSVLLLTGNFLTYHVAGALLLAAVLGAPVLASLLARRVRPRQDALAALVLVLSMGAWIFRTVITGETPGVKLDVREVARLQRAVARRDGACLCVAPYHPIFVREGPRVFRYHELFTPRWSEAVAWALARHPGAVVSLRPPRAMVSDGSISEAQREALVAMLRGAYTPHRFGRATVWLTRLQRPPRREPPIAGPDVVE
jgi:hypothetical protein